MSNIKIKRVYETAQETDGYRVLVDRLWPRGMKKEVAKIDCWAKEITPSTELRKDYHEGRILWEEFVQRYQGELASTTVLDDLICELVDREVVTLVFAGKNVEQNHVMVLLQVMQEKMEKQ